jgi:lipoprotein-releasing system ATP-binding protein
MIRLLSTGLSQLLVSPGCSLTGVENMGYGMLTLEDVHKTFVHHGTSIEILKGVNMFVNPGDSIAITGASGVGKSTLLNIMASLEPPTKGFVGFGGQGLYEMDNQSLGRYRNRDIGLVFQFHHLLPEFNALENTMIPALIARYPKKKAGALARDVLEKVGLGHRLDHRAGELSGGEQQRVAIARALIMGPRLVLADEPTGNLDWSTGQEVASLLQRLNREEGIAIIIATHNSRLAVKMSRHMEIVDGRIR